MTFLSDDAVSRLVSAAAAPPSSGSRYLLLRELGRGGMGTVWLASDSELDREVAVKVIRESSDADAAERLSRELEKSIEDFVARAETEVSDRIVQLARQTADRMEHRLRDIARAVEAQGDLAGDRLRHVTERLNEALADAERRIAVTLQPRERTMTDEEIEALAARIVAEVGKRTGGVLRA